MSSLDIFIYGDKEIQHLKNRDKILGTAIEQIGMIERQTYPDLFIALIRSMVAQQISAKAFQTVWQRMNHNLEDISPGTIEHCSAEHLQAFGISFKKAGYMKNAARKIQSGELDIESLKNKSDHEVCKELSALDGVGIWTAEMLMTFSLQRPNIMSFGDFAIHRGLRMLYHHRKITKELFAKYKRRYSPYATVASLYLWEIAGGAIAGMKDRMPAAAKRK